MRVLIVAILALYALQTTQPAQPRNAADQAAQENDKAPKEVPITEKSTGPPAKTAPDNKQQAANQEPRLWPFHSEWVMVGLTFVYVLATIFYAVTSQRTLNAIKEQGEQNKDLIRQAKASANALIASERAWIMVDLTWEGAPNIVSDGQKYETTAVSFNMTCSNKGKTPAWITEKRVKFELMGTIDPNPDFDSITPSQRHPEWIADTRTEWITREHEGYQPQGGADLRIIYGSVKYRDIFGAERVTTFGYDINLNDELRRIAGHSKYNENT